MLLKYYKATPVKNHKKRKHELGSQRAKPVKTTPRNMNAKD